MKISLVTDEVSNDFDTAIELAYHWGIRFFEIRKVGLKRIPYISKAVLQRIVEAIDRYRIQITALSPGLFKIPFEQRLIKEHLDSLMPKTFELARTLGVKIIIIFGFIKPPGAKGSHYPRGITELLRETAQNAEKEGFTLALENEHVCWADTGENTARIIEGVGNDILRVNWDPGNAFSAGEEPYPRGYEFVKEYVVNVHVKRAFKDPKGKTRYLTTGKGAINWQGQIQALARANYTGYIAIETHLEPKIKESKKCLEILKKIGQDYI